MVCSTKLVSLSKNDEARKLKGLHKLLKYFFTLAERQPILVISLGVIISISFIVFESINSSFGNNINYELYLLFIAFSLFIVVLMGCVAIKAILSSKRIHHDSSDA